ncbi:MAG: hypothetical protein AAGU05_02400, partial [Anaerolineaceae bacterium]
PCLDYVKNEYDGDKKMGKRHLGAAGTPPFGVRLTRKNRPQWWPVSLLAPQDVSRRTLSDQTCALVQCIHTEKLKSGSVRTTDKILETFGGKMREAFSSHNNMVAQSGT